VALIQLLLENQVRANHVESTLLPRLDPGSIPGSSTFALHSFSGKGLRPIRFNYSGYGGHCPLIKKPSITIATEGFFLNTIHIFNYQPAQNRKVSVNTVHPNWQLLTFRKIRNFGRFDRTH